MPRWRVDIIRKRAERERTAARAAAEAKRAEAERKAIAEAEKKIVASWNARQAGGRALWFYPTIGAAIAAGLPWLSFACPACGQFGSVDLRTLHKALFCVG